MKRRSREEEGKSFQPFFPGEELAQKFRPQNGQHAFKVLKEGNWERRRKEKKKEGFCVRNSSTESILLAGKGSSRGLSLEERKSLPPKQEEGRGGKRKKNIVAALVKKSLGKALRGLGKDRERSRGTEVRRYLGNIFLPSRGEKEFPKGGEEGGIESFWSPH